MSTEQTRRISTPDWVKHAVFYQIFPDRFARSGKIDDLQLKLQPWGAPPTPQGFQGGDLWGVIERLDYLQELGITAIYLNPIFSSAANHRYHTYDYYAVDPLLGGNAALRALLDEAHQRNLRVVLDGVFNHTGRGFWPFHHILENGEGSPYLDWFTIRGWPLRPYSASKTRPCNYDAWWSLPALPKLNLKNPRVREFIFDVARHWIDFGIDGWRLDVADEIKDDAFWRRFRAVVKRANPEAYICGEVWGEAQRWLQGDQFDATMNYTFAWSALSFFGQDSLRPDYRRKELRLGPLKAAAFSRIVNQMLARYDWQINLVQLNLLDSHDMARALWILGDDSIALQMCVLFQMTMPGAPSIYYGDEIGMSSGDDPHCRAAFPWHRQNDWNRDLLAFYRRAIRLRHQYEVLRTGRFETLYARNRLFAFRRWSGERQAVIVFNTGRARGWSLSHRNLPPGKWKAVWPLEHGGSFENQAGRINLDLPARAGVVLLK